jgi:phage tail tape-measure protein
MGAMVVTLMVGAAVGSSVITVVGSTVGSTTGASVGSWTGDAVGNVSSTLVGIGVGLSPSPPCMGETVGSDATGVMVGSSVVPCAITPVKHWKIKISTAQQWSNVLIFKNGRYKIRMQCVDSQFQSC